jgi:hypothetical protein
VLSTWSIKPRRACPELLLATGALARLWRRVVFQDTRELHSQRYAVRYVKLVLTSRHAAGQLQACVFTRGSRISEMDDTPEVSFVCIVPWLRQ